MIGYEAAETGDEQITIGINIPTDVYLAIKKGEALLNTTLGKSGVTAWVQFLDPDRAHLTYTLEDAANELARASPPEGVIVPVYARPSTSERSNLNRIRMGITEAEDRITTKKLDRHRKQGVLNFYPTDSLVDEDFRRTDDKDFAARATVVAHRLGSANAISGSLLRWATMVVLKLCQIGGTMQTRMTVLHCSLRRRSFRGSVPLPGYLP